MTERKQDSIEFPLNYEARTKKIIAACIVPLLIQWMNQQNKKHSRQIAGIAAKE